LTKDFFDCAEHGGKVVNKKTRDGRILKICYDREGNSYVKRNFNNNKSKKNPPLKKQTIASMESLQKLAAHFNDNKLI